MNDESIKIINYLLENKGKWSESKALADLLLVTPRTIRTHIKNINGILGRQLVYSSHKGYKIEDSDFININQLKDNSEKREEIIISKLLLKDNYLFLDLADELYVSETTLNNDLNKCKTILEDYKLKIIRKNAYVTLSGLERDKRKLINHMIKRENFKRDFFVVDSNLKNTKIDEDGLMLDLKKIILHSGYYINDYNLINLVSHLMIAMYRIENDESIEGGETELDKDGLFYDITIKIAQSVSDNYNIQLNDNEKRLLNLLLQSVINSSIDGNSQYNNRDNYYFLLSKKIMRKLSDAYYLNDFDNEFHQKFAVHLECLQRRQKLDYVIGNPLTFQMQLEYPIIFEFAIFVAGELYKNGFKQLDDNEIAFIAFHIGAYLGNNVTVNKKVKCCYLYLEYHNTQNKFIDTILNKYGNEIEFVQIAPYSNSVKINEDVELIISNLEINNSNFYSVQVSPFINQKDIAKIEEAISNIKINSKIFETKKIIQSIFSKELYINELYANTNIELINKASDYFLKEGYCQKDFVDLVLAREKLSSTSFPQGIAIPHAFNIKGTKSFMCLISNKDKIQWGNNKVDLILFVGISKNDWSRINGFFEELIKSIYDESNLNIIRSASNYEQVVEELAKMIVK